MSWFSQNVNNDRGVWRWALLLGAFGGLSLFGLTITHFRGSRSNTNATATQRQTSSQIDDLPAVVDADQSIAAADTLRRPTRICDDLRVLDIQVGANNQIEGAWLAAAQSESPVMVAVGQGFGSGILRRAMLDEARRNPEVWMDTELGRCRASLSEPYVATKHAVGMALAPSPSAVSEQKFSPKLAAKAASLLAAHTETRSALQLTSSQIMLVKRLAKDFPRPIVKSTQDAGAIIDR